MGKPDHAVVYFQAKMFLITQMVELKVIVFLFFSRGASLFLVFVNSKLIMSSLRTSIGNTVFEVLWRVGKFRANEKKNRLNVKIICKAKHLLK